MADKNIGLLPKAVDLDDDSLLVAEQQGRAVSVSGELFKQFAREGVEAYVGEAKTAAENASKSAEQAAEDLGKIGDSVEQAAASAQAAEESNQDAKKALTATKEAQEAAEKAQGVAKESETNAKTSEGNASQAATDAATSETNAKTSATNAATSEGNAKSAQEAAEAAKGKAESASTTATNKAAEASQSAEKAQQYSGKPPLVQGGNWWTWNAEKQSYEDTGKKAILTYDKTYASVQAMNADTQPENTVAIISSSVDDEDNAKLYISDGAKWNYLADLSGFTGVGVAKVEQTSGNHAPGTTDTYTLTLTDGTTQEIPVYNGADGEGTGDMKAETYDPQGKRTDVYQYADDAAKEVKAAIPTKVSELENDSGYLKDYTETDPTVPDWAKQPEKPKYTAADVGAAQPGELFSVTLKADSWADSQQTASGERFLSKGYGYIVSPASGSLTAYTRAFVRAGDVTEDGKMVFICEKTPAEDLEISIFRIESKN
jgi:hypothetical protein